MDTTAGDATDAEWPFPEPDDVVGWTIVRTGHAVGRAFTRELAAVGLKPHIFGVLAQARHSPGLSSAELARHVLVTPQSMGEILRRMAADGLVEYTPPKRGQRMRVHLTDAGSDLLDRAFQVVGAMNAPTYLGLSPEESRHLNTLLHKVLTATG
ncbi:MarR family transcriptional regulator [Virgisporangium ochraceum]|uniref:Putative HTH-type transcriptional regulator n=1 Tax=Virgisporangium ochraceum TaxID=65505 RepID=A0A8J3ZYE4_9ACTN|nr:MarR family winged helix-turn-helix transcriptional regulator [Virgisporangium ochraceum]GIJ72377.1 putative HTH-type transcriptional regulator [Virgisporangium ochraceum]